MRQKRWMILRTLWQVDLLQVYYVADETFGVGMSRADYCAAASDRWLLHFSN